MKVTFENATIADSITKAARVAPTKGEAFDKANGILMVLDPDDNTVTLKATDLHLFYLEVVDAVDVDEAGTWRFHAQTLAQVMTKLPIGTGKTVTLEQKGGTVELKSGRTTAKFRTIDASYYPEWEPFDPDKLEMVPDLGARIKQVEWAAMDEHEVIYAGIHMNGKQVIATDRVRMAVVECETDVIYRPVTIPAGILRPIMTGLRDVAVGIDEGMFLMMPDVSTQIKTRIYDKEYPNVLRAIEEREWNDEVKVRKNRLIEIIDRAMVFAQRDRSPKMTFIIGKGEIAVMCADSDLGLLGDVLELEGQADHPRHKIMFTPRNLVEALSNAPSEEVIFKYKNGEGGYPVLIDGGSGYTALVMPRREVEGGG